MVESISKMFQSTVTDEENKAKEDDTSQASKAKSKLIMDKEYQKEMIEVD